MASTFVECFSINMHYYPASWCHGHILMCFCHVCGTRVQTWTWTPHQYSRAAVRISSEQNSQMLQFQVKFERREQDRITWHNSFIHLCTTVRMLPCFIFHLCVSTQLQSRLQCFLFTMFKFMFFPGTSVRKFVRDFTQSVTVWGFGRCEAGRKHSQLADIYGLHFTCNRKPNWKKKKN